jgi:hypothetical protein
MTTKRYEPPFLDDIAVRLPRGFAREIIDLGRKQGMTGEEWCRRALLKAVEVEIEGSGRNANKRRDVR